MAKAGDEPMLLSLRDDGDDDGTGRGCDLLCTEGAGALDDGPLAAARPAFLPDDSDELIAGFVVAAAAYLPRSDYPGRLRSRSLDLLARSDSVSWIRKVQGHYGFRPSTAYLAVNYMDRLLSLHSLPESGWAMQLLSVACLSLSAKMEETLIPSLLDLQVVVEGTRYIFEPRTIRRMELFVLTALDWRLRSITPFTFIDFFAHKADSSLFYARQLVSCATHIILAAVHDIDLLDHCPSSIAAAAIICAAEETSALASINSKTAASWCIGLTEEGISRCYQLMRGIAVSGTQRKQPMILSQLRVTTTVDFSTGVSSNSSPSPPSKRRRLNQD